MVDHKKVQPVGLIKNLKIDLAGCEYKISITLLNMENGTRTYSMFLGRTWLKQANENHNWGDSTLTITVGVRTMIMSTIKKIALKPS
jgi:hypothetical protein